MKHIPILFTPGPWFIAASNFDTGFHVIHANDNTSKFCHETQVVKIEYGHSPVHEYLEKAQANAKLIAAAPELLEALQELIHLHLCEQEGLSSGQPTIQQWIAAVDKGAEVIKKAVDKPENWPV